MEIFYKLKNKLKTVLDRILPLGWPDITLKSKTSVFGKKKLREKLMKLIGSWLEKSKKI